MVKKKGKSKRVTLKDKYKIAKKVREHNRKLRKKARKDAKKGIKAKDPGIPNSWPFKQELLQQIEESRVQQEAAQEAEKAKRKSEKLKRKKERAKESKRRKTEAENAVNPQLSREQVMQLDTRNAINESDIVLVVLDARDPIGTRPLSLESGLLVKGKKKIVLVLNKTDLVTEAVATKWLKYLRKFHPCFATTSIDLAAAADSKVTGKKRKQSRSQQAIIREKLNSIHSKHEIGNSAALKEFLKVASKSLGNPETGIKVAVIGYPNTGKSSVINSLKRSEVTTVASGALTTTRSFKCQMEGNVTLIDTPALPVKFADPESPLMLYSIAEQHVIEAVDAITPVIKRCEALDLMTTYNIPKFKEVNDFLALVAKKRGLFIPGGEPDLLGTARQVFADLGRGKISFFVSPPTSKPKGYEMPEWFTSLALGDEIERLQTEGLAVRPALKAEPLVIKASVKDIATAATDEYDLLMKDVSEVQSDSEEEEEESEEEGEEESEEEESEEEEEEEEPVPKKKAKVAPAKKTATATKAEKVPSTKPNKSRKEETAPTPAKAANFRSAKSDKGNKEEKTPAPAKAERSTRSKSVTKEEKSTVASTPKKPVSSKSQTTKRLTRSSSKKSAADDTYDFKSDFFGGK